jgi:DNA-binding protein HU-beta
VQNSLKNDGNIGMDGLGAFLVTQRKARTGVSPRTKDKIMIPVTNVPKFRAAQVLKDAVRPQEKPKEKKASKKTK